MPNANTLGAIAKASRIDPITTNGICSALGELLTNPSTPDIAAICSNLARKMVDVVPGTRIQSGAGPLIIVGGDPLNGPGFLRNFAGGKQVVKRDWDYDSATYREAAPRDVRPGYFKAIFDVDSPGYGDQIASQSKTQTAEKVPASLGPGYSIGGAGNINVTWATDVGELHVHCSVGSGLGTHLDFEYAVSGGEDFFVAHPDIGADPLVQLTFAVVVQTPKPRCPGTQWRNPRASGNEEGRRAILPNLSHGNSAPGRRQGSSRNHRDTLTEGGPTLTGGRGGRATWLVATPVAALPARRRPPGAASMTERHGRRWLRGSEHAGARFTSHDVNREAVAASVEAEYGLRGNHGRLALGARPAKHGSGTLELDAGARSDDKAHPIPNALIDAEM